MAPISQREARRLWKRLGELEHERDLQRNAWASEYPGGVNIDTFDVDATTHARILTARKLGHAVVVTAHGKFELRLYALPLPK